MVMLKRLDYGFNGYQVPPTPRATRSPRRRGSFWKKVHNQMCAFDLLATVAGKLLMEGKHSSSSSDTIVEKEQCAMFKDLVNKVQEDEDQGLELKSCDQGSCGKGFFVSELLSQAPIVYDGSKEFPHARNHACSGIAFVNGETKIELGSFASKVDVDSSGDRVLLGCKLEKESRSFASKVDVDSSGNRALSNCKLENESWKHITFDLPNTEKASIISRTGIFSSEDPVICDGKPPALVNSDNSVKLSFRDRAPCGSLPKCRGDVKLVFRDGDGNASGCTQPSTANKAYRTPPRIGDRRIRKLLASKYWKVTPKMKDEEHFNNDVGIKPVYRIKNGYKRQRSQMDYPFKCQRLQRDYPFKKRKFYEHRSTSISDGRISSDGISSSPGKGSNGDASGLGAAMHGVTGPPASAAGQHAYFQSTDSHVKLKIKSFRVPELFIEIPETATVGSLKMSVMEAVTAILNGDLCVGVLYHGKKIRDDNKTLFQTGICHDNKSDVLGFSLEPNPLQATQSLNQEDHPFQLPCHTSQPVTRYPPALKVVHNPIQLETSDVPPDHPVTNFGYFIDSNHDSVPSPPDMSVDKGTTDSRALVSVPAMNVEALAVVPMRKSKQSDSAQRRIRRPFSVSEVEALVKAVEKLGTGRWRDVKLRAFDNAKHRTYVDLKDKWKTLVHTARISPQQRRGEPVPQELLDRVLIAHAYWSQQQPKQQLKQQPET